MGIEGRRVRVYWLNRAVLVVAACAVPGLAFSGVTAIADEPAVVIEDDVVVVSDDEDTVVVDEATDRVWAAMAVKPREVNGHLAYIRQSTDAFADPDKPLALEPNYYFVLDAVPWTESGNLSPGDSPSSSETIRLGRRARKLSFAKAFPFPENVGRIQGDLHLQWLDMQVGPLETRRTLAALYVPRNSRLGELAVLRVRAEGGDWKVEKIAASRSIPAQQLQAAAPEGSLIATYNPPDEMGGARVFFGKVLAVLTEDDDRYAVAFHGEALHESGECRVLLPAKEHPMGRPVAIRFIELPIIREDDRVVPATVLAVAYEDAQGRRSAIAVDYPLASTPLMVQMRQLVTRENKRGGEDDTDDRLTKLLGEDLVDELARRLVNAKY